MKDKKFAALFTFLLAILALSLSVLDLCKPREEVPFEFENDVELMC